MGTEIWFLYNVKIQGEGVFSGKDIDSLRLCSVNSSILLTNGIPLSETHRKLLAGEVYKTPLP